MNALPCIACGRELENDPIVGDGEPYVGIVNQPSGGTAFQSYGHYGSTAFDPMDGSYIEINVCDDCLRAARDRQLVAHSRDRKPVVCGGGHVGWTKADRPLVYWPDAVTEREDELEVDPDEIGAEWLPEIEWVSGAQAWKKEMQRRMAEVDE